MNDPERRPSERLLELLNGYRVSQAIHVAATLGLAELLGTGPQTAAELAGQTGTHPGSLARLLRALAAAGVLEAQAGGRYALTPVGEVLRPDAPESLEGMAAYIGRPYVWQAWVGLLHSVQTGENAFAHLHGQDLWAYRASHPEEHEIFDRAMTGNTRRVQAALLEATDFGRYETVVDVGGGLGTLLAALLEAHPGLKAVLFDQPQVVAQAAPLLAAAGLTERCRVVGGDFFEGVPGGGDAYLLKFVLHDWEDPEAVQLLRRCREAAAPGATLLVIERLMGEGTVRLTDALSDLNMLVGPGGRERTLEDYRALFAEGGFTLLEARPSRSGLTVIEGTADLALGERRDL